jgi:hypothetical protein
LVKSLLPRCKDTCASLSHIADLSQEVLYYCETQDDHKLIFHRGIKSGPVIATGAPCLEAEGCTDIHFTDPKVTISVQHVNHVLPFFHDKNCFKFDDKNFHWKDHHELIEDDTNVLFATFQPSWLEGQGHRIGQLFIKSDGQEMRDIVVVTSLAVQERADEYQKSVSGFCDTFLLNVD